MANTKDLADSEPHPAAQDAMNWIKSSMSTRELLRWHEAFASNAIAGNRLAEVCVETCRRLIEGEPVSDRYLLGLAWAIRYGKSDLSSNAKAQLPPEQAKPAEGTQSATALWAVNCSDLLGDCIAQTLPPFGWAKTTSPAERSPRFVANESPMPEDSKA